MAADLQPELRHARLLATQCDDQGGGDADGALPGGTFRPLPDRPPAGVLDDHLPNVDRPPHPIDILPPQAKSLRSQIDEVRRRIRPVRIEHQLYHRPPAEPIRLTIDVAPLISGDGRQFAVLLTFTDTTRTFTLQQELEAAQEGLETTVEELQSANEELETTNEELQSTNEELETTNEELQSTNEELETTNEELRSANEELETTNEELRRHSDEFGAFRRYVDAILRGVDAGVVVVDAELKVRSWNRWSENAWGLREEEVIGQPFGSLDIGLPVQELEAPLREAVAQSKSKETVADGLDRRGRSMQCRVRITPLTYDDRSTQGAVLLVEDHGTPDA
jgi:two-component system, chemotaxis family, CheB/CheR fusion protein